MLSKSLTSTASSPKICPTWKNFDIDCVYSQHRGKIASVYCIEVWFHTLLNHNAFSMLQHVKARYAINEFTHPLPTWVFVVCVCVCVREAVGVVVGQSLLFWF